MRKCFVLLHPMIYLIIELVLLYKYKGLKILKLSIKKKVLRIAIILIILLVLGLATVFGINTFIKTSSKKRFLSLEEATNLDDVDCILVLGAGVWGDRPTHMLEDRLEYGISLYKMGASGKLLMSGDHGRENYDEVNVMKNYAVNHGVLSSDVFMDHAGFSTYESIYRARDIFEAEKIIIVTQEYHLYRALLLLISSDLKLME